MNQRLKFRRLDGSLITTAKVIGRGGEGFVYTLDSNPNLAAKIYKQSISDTRRDKIFSMTQKQWHKNTALVAFPIEPIAAEDGKFAGFLMHLVRGYKPIHELYSPSDRKRHFASATYPFLVRSASNIAKAFASVHSLGCVIGDVNHSGILVSNDATVVLIDSDSFQFSDGSNIFLCRVGVPEFTPPELQEVDLSSVRRTHHHDNFGLAVLIFHLLMMGRHPYDGVFKGSGEMDRMRAIKERLFAYSPNSARTRMEPPPNAPLLRDLPSHLADAFEKAFCQTDRPSAADWAMLLDTSERTLVKCRTKSQHHYFGNAPECRWCAIERSFPGYELFPAVPIFGLAANENDLPALKAELNQIVIDAHFDPMSAMRAFNIVPSALKTTIGSNANRKYAVGSAIVALAIGLGFLAPSAIVIAVLIGGAGLVYGLREDPAAAKLRRRKNESEEKWKAELSAYIKLTDSTVISRLKSAIANQIQRLEELPAAESRMMSELKKRQREIQLRTHLENHRIQNHSISKITSQLKGTLRSFGIETAFDISSRRISSVPGFGPVRTNAMVAWRSLIESRFVFDPNKALAQSDIANVRNTIAMKRSALVQETQRQLSLCKTKVKEVVTYRTIPPASCSEAYAALLQARMDADGLAIGYGDYLGSRIGSTTTIMLAISVIAFVAGTNILLKASKPGFSPTPVSSPVPQPAPASSLPQKTVSTVSDQVKTTSTVVQNIVPSEQHLLGTTSQPPFTVGGSADPNVSNGPMKLPLPAALPQPNAGLLKPLPPPIYIESRPEIKTVDSGMTRSIKKKGDVMEIQKKLSDLGLYKGAMDGIWGPNSKAGLRRFKTDHNLGDDDDYDAPTERYMFSNE